VLGIELSHGGQYREAEVLFREGIQVADRAIQTAWYNFACGAAIAGHQREAFGYLRQAINHGYQSADDIAADHDLNSLHGDPRFEALVADARKRSAAASTASQKANWFGPSRRSAGGLQSPHRTSDIIPTLPE
jgi:hypothetical protein